MGSKGSTRHNKRLSAPVTYAIKRKHGVFTIRPFPTRGPFDLSIPLGIIVREKLGYAKTLNEAKKILHNKAYNSHILTKKSPKRKRNLGKQDLVSKADKGNIKDMLPYSF